MQDIIKDALSKGFNPNEDKIEILQKQFLNEIKSASQNLLALSDSRHIAENIRMRRVIQNTINDDEESYDIYA